MQPILFESKYILVESLWLFVALGFVAAGILFIHLAKKNGLRLNFILDHGFKITLISLLFARLVYVLNNWQFFFYEYTLSELKYIFYFWDKGLSFWGAILGLFFALRYFCKKHGEDLNKWLDITIISIFLALIIGSIGLFLDGSSYGHETDLPWGINFESITIRYSVPIHPTQLYAAFYNSILFVSFFWLYKHRIFKHNGDIFLAGTSTFCLFKFLEEFFRGDESFMLLGLRTAQYFTLIIGLITLLLLLERYNKVNLNKVRNILKLTKKYNHGNT